MTVALLIFMFGFLLVLQGNRALSALYRKQGAAVVGRKQRLLTPWFWIIMGLGLLAVDLIQMRQGVVQGVRIGILTRADHPWLFWGITVGMALAALLLMVMNFSEFAQAWRNTEAGTNGADDRT